MAKKTKVKNIDNKRKSEKEIKKENKKENKRLLTSYQISFLCFLCSVCWIISAFLYKIAGENPVFDIIVGIVFIVIGVLYLLKGRKEKNAR